MSAMRIGGRYEWQKTLKAGGQADVYEMRDLHEGGVVVVKLLKRVPPGGIWAEARILRDLEDHHILRIRNADLHLGRPYLATNKAEYGTLEDQLDLAGSCGLQVDDVVRWIKHACTGVARAHDRRLLHNDLKPGNLFLNAKGECLVGDFGYAAEIPAGQTSTVIAGATAETAAPEVAARWHTGAPRASIRSDVYSLGATAFWLLAARPPHDFSSVPDDKRFAAVAAEVPPRLRNLAPHVPLYEARTIERAMARNASSRFPSVAELFTGLGNRPRRRRHWRRTDEHGSHLMCWRGESASGGSTYIMCLEQGIRARERVVTTRHEASHHRVTAGCRKTTEGSWAQAVRSAMQAVG